MFNIQLVYGTDFFVYKKTQHMDLIYPTICANIFQTSNVHFSFSKKLTQFLKTKTMHLFCIHKKMQIICTKSVYFSNIQKYWLFMRKLCTIHISFYKSKMETFSVWVITDFLYEYCKYSFTKIKLHLFIHLYFAEINLLTSDRSSQSSIYKFCWWKSFF